VPGITGAVATASNTRMELFYWLLMARKFSLKLYKGYQLVNIPGGVSYNEHIDEVEFTPESDEYFLTFKEFTFNEEIDESIYDVKESFENINEVFIKNEFDKNQRERDEFILIKNKEQVKIAAEKLAKWKIKKKAHPDSLTVQRRIQYLDTVNSEFEHWFDVHGLEFPSITEINANKGKQEPRSPNESTNPIKLSSFICELLNNKDARKYLKSEATYKKKEEFVRNAIEESSLNIKYKSVTLTRYIKPDKIEEFLSKKK